MFTVCWPVVLSRWPFSESPPAIERGLHLLVVGCGLHVCSGSVQTGLIMQLKVGTDSGDWSTRRLRR